MSRGWHRYRSPWWSWDAWRAFCVQVLGVTDKQPHVAALNDAHGAGLWWPHSRFVIVADRPTIINRERVGPDGWNSHVLHCDDGPAVAWGNEWAVYSWHGTRVPAWVYDDLTIERIAAERNTEIRRCAIERYGWDRYLDHLGASPVDVADDPGNPGHRLELFDLPDGHQVYDGRVRLLVMRNASLDRDGSRRTFAETVPADLSDAVAAAAWQFDVDVDTYRALERAT